MHFRLAHNYALAYMVFEIVAVWFCKISGHLIFQATVWRVQNSISINIIQFINRQDV